MRVRLMPLDDSPPIEINKDLLLVGRKEDCDIMLDHKSVSKIHCVIVKTDGLLLLRDLGSTNGTRVNGQRVRRAALLPNDHVHIASLRFKVHFSNDEDSPPSSAEYTQQMNAKDVAKLINKPDVEEQDSAPDLDLPPIQANSLPDVYPDGPK